jgi:hypothetical protein
MPDLLHHSTLVIGVRYSIVILTTLSFNEVSKLIAHLKLHLSYRGP